MAANIDVHNTINSDPYSTKQYSDDSSARLPDPTTTKRKNAIAYGPRGYFSGLFEPFET